MSNCQLTNENGGANRHFSSQLHLEKESMVRINQYYIAQVSQMEIKISELKAHLHAKDSEIIYLNEKVKTYEANKVDADAASTDYEGDVGVNEDYYNMRSSQAEPEDIIALKIQLDHALRMKDAFEMKYRETIEIKLITKETDKLNSLKLENSKLLSDISQAITNLETAKTHNSDLKAEIFELKKAISDKDEYIELITSQYERILKQTHVELKALEDTVENKVTSRSQLVSSPRLEDKINLCSPTNNPKFSFFDEEKVAVSQPRKSEEPEKLQSCRYIKKSVAASNTKISECMNTSYTLETKSFDSTDKLPHRSRSSHAVPRLNVCPERLNIASILSPKNSMESTKRHLKLKQHEFSTIKNTTSPQIADFCPNFLRSKKLDIQSKKENRPAKENFIKPAFLKTFM